MSSFPTLKILAGTIGLALLTLTPAEAATVLYNTNGGNFLVGNDGKLPAAWVGTGSAPATTGSMDRMWYVDLQASDTANLTTADAIAKGAASTFRLGTGPAAWAPFANGGSASGHGLDYGLVQLNGPADLTITLTTDVGSSTKPAFSLYQGWDTGTTFSRTGTYTNNINNPLGTVGLNYLNQASTTTAGGTASFTFSNLASGDYTLLLGGNGTSSDVFGNGHYQLTLATTAVPVPAAVWLFGSALAGMGVIGRRKQKPTA